MFRAQSCVSRSILVGQAGTRSSKAQNATVTVTCKEHCTHQRQQCYNVFQLKSIKTQAAILDKGPGVTAEVCGSSSANSVQGPGLIVH